MDNKEKETKSLIHYITGDGDDGFVKIMVGMIMLVLVIMFLMGVVGMMIGSRRNCYRLLRIVVINGDGGDNGGDGTGGEGDDEGGSGRGKETSGCNYCDRTAGQRLVRFPDPAYGVTFTSVGEPD